MSLNSSKAQKAPEKFGEISMDDMLMKSYPNDTSASAVVLFDYSKESTEFSQAATRSSEHHVRIKILKKDGLSQGDIEFFLRTYGYRENYVGELKAVTYNLENNVIVKSKLSKEGVFKERINKYVVRQKFTMPDVRVGSVLEYYYTIRDVGVSDWYYQRDIPVRFCEHWLTYPAYLKRYYDVETVSQGYFPVTEFVNTSMQVEGLEVVAYHMKAINVPAFKKEPMMTSTNDLISRINFRFSDIRISQQNLTSLSSWENINEYLLTNEHFGSILGRSLNLNDKVDQLVAGIQDPLQKIDTIRRWVMDNIKWNGYYSYLCYSPKKVIDDKKGDSGDMNLIMASLLRKAGFEVKMILISTRQHGFVRRDIPDLDQFNNTICMVLVEGKTLFLDATEKYLPKTMLPVEYLNDDGLIISEAGLKWINIKSSAKARSIVNGDFKLNSNGKLTGELSYQYEGYDAFEMRKKYFSEGKEKYEENLTANKLWTIDKTTFENVDVYEKPAKESHTLEIEDFASVAGSQMYLNPMVVEQLIENPFKSETRMFPIYYRSAKEQVYVAKIRLPEGYEVDHLPAAKAINLPGNSARFIYNSNQMGNDINITISFQINRNLFIETEYQQLKEFYNQVITKQAEQIVIKKK